FSHGQHSARRPTALVCALVRRTKRTALLHALRRCVQNRRTLTNGIYAIQAPEVPVSYDKAAQYAVAATYHAEHAGLDPYMLVGIARNESDFVEDMRGPDGKDCGLMQTRVTVTGYSCKALRRSYWLAFQEGAREMKEYTASCAGHADFDRCRLNRY